MTSYDLIWVTLLGAVELGLRIFSTIHAVMRKRDTRAVIGWVGLIWLAPFVGSIAYFCFGINRIKRRALSLELRHAWAPRQPEVEGEPVVADPEPFENAWRDWGGMANLGWKLTGTALQPGNEVVPLLNGDEAYPAMLKAIDSAEKSVALLSYIFDADQVGHRFRDALNRARERGVEVRVLIDHAGARYSSPSMARLLHKDGLEVKTFLPSHLIRPTPYANLRNHRKILVVDGMIGFTGGTNIREGHWLGLNPKHPVECLHFRVEGPVVRHLQRAFAMDWAFASKESLQGDLWFPEIPAKGPVWARGISDGPDEDFESLLNVILGALAEAREKVRIVTPYFLPETTLIHALNVAAMRGVSVEILIPGKNNIRPVQWASDALLWQLLEKGCRVFKSSPPFDHTKLMVVDGAWSLVGSTNWDPRSLRLNFEYNIECYDRALGERLENVISEKVAVAEEVTLDDLSKLALPVTLRNNLARLLIPYL